MSVLITGAAGRLGSEVCRQFASAGIAFRATDRHTNRDLPCEIVVADIRNREACYPLVADCDAVVHLANYPNSTFGDAQTVFNENCAMNMNIFQAATEAGVKKLIFASSVQAMSGDRRFDDKATEQKPSALPYLPLDGIVPANPGNPYAASKVAGEMLLNYFCQFHGISGIALRFPMLLPLESLARWRAEGPQRLSRGLNLDEAFTLLTFSDATKLIISILRAQLEGFRVYFPTARTPWLDLSLPEIVRRYFSSVPLRQPADKLASLVDHSSIQRETGWQPEDEPRAL
jgi:nucleoside-diphosphate-sugar epimerase